MKIEDASWDEYDAVVRGDGLVVRILDDGCSINVHGVIRDFIETPRFRAEVKRESTSNHKQQGAPGDLRSPSRPKVGFLV